MDDRKLNPLRLIILAFITAYFAASLWTNHSDPAARVSLNIKPADHAPTATSPAATGCAGRITWATAGAREVRLGIDGAAEKIIVYTEKGPRIALTENSGSAGEYRVSLPAPPQAVQIDNCEAVNLP
jgi:hypothetical protein